MSDGCVGSASAIHGLACSGLISSATVTTLTPSDSISSCSACHPGRAVRQPHQLAQATMMMRRPRSELKSKVRPIASMSEEGKNAFALASARPVAVATPSAHMLCGASCTSGMPNFFAATVTSTTPLLSAPGAGTQSSPRHKPSGLASQPVAARNSGTLSWVPEIIINTYSRGKLTSLCRSKPPIVGNNEGE